MKSIVRLCAAAAFACLFAPYASADEGLYLRLAAGGGHVDEDSYGDFDFELGYVGSAAIGYNWFFPESFADVRVEVEGAYRYNDIDEYDGVSADGQTEAFSAMLNGYLDFRTTLPFVPYVGFGIGATRVKHEDDGAGGTVPVIDDHDTVFAYQVMGGINFDLSDNLAVGAEYRFHETEKFQFVYNTGGTFTRDYNHHSVLVTLTVGF